MKQRYKLFVIPLLILAVVFFYIPQVSAAEISQGSTYASTDGTSGRLVINSVSSSISGSTWNVSINYTINMVNSYLYTGGSGYYRYFSATIGGVNGGAVLIKSNTESWAKSTSHSFTYTMSLPVNSDNNIASARFMVYDGSGNYGDVATFDTGSGNTVSLQAVQKATSLSVNASEITLYSGESFSISANVSPDNTYNKAVSYSSANPSIASVTSSGVIKAISAGTTSITVKTADGSNISKSITVTVKQYVTAVSLTASASSIDVGSNTHLSVEIKPSAATDQSVTYVSNNTQVATVSADGKVTGKKAGTALITATANDRGTVSNSVLITVIQKATSLTLSSSEAVLYTAETFTLSPSIAPADTTNQSLSYSSSDETIASVSNTGVVTATKAGEAVITVSTTDGSNLSASMNLTVKQYVTSIVLSEGDRSLYTGEAFTLSVAAYPSDASYSEVVFSSDHPEIAAVDPDGTIHALSAGTATITATAADRMSVSASMTVTVLQHAEEVITKSEEVNLDEGSTLSLSCTVLPADTSNPTLSYVSENSEIAEVSDTGIIYAKEKGTTTITVTAADQNTVSKTIKVVVVRKVSDIELSDEVPTKLYTGEKFTLHCSAQPEDANNTELTYESNDESVLTVSASGTVRAVTAGEAILLISSTDGSNITKEYPITVYQSVTEITIKDKLTLLKVDETSQITANILPDDAYCKTLLFSSSNDEVASATDDGVITANSPGVAFIKVSASDPSGITKMITVIVTKAEESTQMQENTEITTANKTTTKTSGITEFGTILGEDDHSETTLTPTSGSASATMKNHQLSKRVISLISLLLIIALAILTYFIKKRMDQREEN